MPVLPKAKPLLEVTLYRPPPHPASSERYPATFEHRGAGFHTDIACELEMLSDTPLDLLHDTVKSARIQHRNLVKERYTNLFRKTGGMSLREREEEAAKTVSDKVLGK